MPISQNTALFSLLGTFYGGDGKSTFGLPNLQGSIAIGQGQLPGGSDYFIGEASGVPHVTLISTEMPFHTHNFLTDTDDAPADNTSPANASLSTSNASAIYTTGNSQLVTMNPQMIAITGNSQPHNNMMPTLTMNFCIALQGIFPARP